MHFRFAILALAAQMANVIGSPTANVADTTSMLIPLKRELKLLID